MLREEFESRSSVAAGSRQHTGRNLPEVVTQIVLARQLQKKAAEMLAAADTLLHDLQVERLSFPASLSTYLASNLRTSLSPSLPSFATSSPCPSSLTLSFLCDHPEPSCTPLPYARGWINLSPPRVAFPPSPLGPYPTPCHYLPFSPVPFPPIPYPKSLPPSPFPSASR